METDFDENYECSALSLSKRMDFYVNYIGEYRDSILVERFLALKSPKVAIIYGTSHFKGFYKKLKDYDSNWVVSKD